jgi:signal transduction histidine kinase/ABC-type amino acid transport substrate-binding protein
MNKQRRIKLFGLFLLFFVWVYPQTKMKQDTLCIGTVPAYAPYQYLDEQQQLKGLTIELIQEVMQHLEMPYKFKILNAQNWIQQFQDNQVDILLDAKYFGVLKGKALFSYPISYNNLGVFCLKGRSITKIEDLDALPIGIWDICIKTVDLVQQVLPNKTCKKYASFKELVEALRKGEVKAVICPYYTFYFYKDRLKDKFRWQEVTKLHLPSENAFAVHLEDSFLIRRINAKLFELKNEGTFDAIESKYLDVLEEENKIPLSMIFVFFFILLFFIIAYPQLLKLLRRRRTERIEKAQFFEHIIKNINYPIYVKDVENNNQCVFWNKAAQEHFGDAKNKNIDAVFGEQQAHKIEALEQRLYRKNKSYVGYEQVVTVSGQKHDTQVIKTWANDGYKDYLLVVRGIITNLVDARKKAEKEGQLISSFLANMSHEIRTPLNAIVGFSELLTENNDPEEQKEYINIVRTNTQLMLKLVGDIIHLSTYDSGNISLNKEWIDMNLFLEDMRTTYLHQLKEANKHQQIKLVVDQPYDLFRIRSDKNLWMQVVTNLLNNAVKYTQEGEIRLGSVFYKGEIILYVKDTGVGIAPENLSKVFSRYTRFDKEEQGHGLGMAICSAIMKNVEGSIQVISRPNKGSIFWVKVSFKSHVVKKERYDWSPINDVFRQIRNQAIKDE